MRDETGSGGAAPGGEEIPAEFEGLLSSVSPTSTVSSAGPVAESGEVESSDVVTSLPIRTIAPVGRVPDALELIHEGDSLGLPDQLETVDRPARKGAAGQTHAGGSPEYRLVKLIAQGGMGEVWEAEQTSLGRLVAVKRLPSDLHGGVDPESFALRQMEFRHEAHVAASLEHPNILPVHDLGQDDEGTPLLAMKLVEGKPWDEQLSRDFDAMPPDEYLARHVPTLIAMTQAVAFAHSRGIVHRDLKPAQVLVGAFGEVLLSDWGLAMLWGTDEERTERESHDSLAIRHIRRRREWPIPDPASASNPAGTPALMAPEQTISRAKEIGPWTDVYLLGGTLYFLLCGKYPHECGSSRAAFEHARRGIVQPPNERAQDRMMPEELVALCARALHPSREQRLDSAEDFLAALEDYMSGTRRHRRSREITTEVRAELDGGELDYGVYSKLLARIEEARALWSQNPEAEALRTRALTASTERALERGDLALARVQAESLTDATVSEPLLVRVAREEAATARRRKLLRVSAVAILLMMAIITAGALVFTHNTREHNRQLAEATTRTEEQRDRAMEAEKIAEERADEAERNLAIALSQSEGAFDLVNFVLRDLKTALDEELTIERGITVTAANEASHAIAGRVATPVVSYFTEVEMVDWPNDLKLERAQQMVVTASVFQVFARYDEALALTTPTLSLREELLGKDSHEVADSLERIGRALTAKAELEEALPLLERAFAIRETVAASVDPDNREAYESSTTGYTSTAEALGNLHFDLGQYGPSREYRTAMLEFSEKHFGPEHHRTMDALSSLGYVAGHLGEYDEARELFERAYEVRTRTQAPDSSDLAQSQYNLAWLAAREGDTERARDFYQRASDTYTVALGPEHPTTLNALNSVATQMHRLGQSEEALALHRHTLDLRRKVFGEQHPIVAESLNNVAFIVMTQEEEGAALPIFEEALAIREIALGPEHPSTGVSLSNLGGYLRNIGRPEEAVPYLERAIAVWREAFGDEHRYTATAINNLGTALQDLGRSEEALEVLTEGVEIRRKIRGPYHPLTARTISSRSKALIDLKRFDEAFSDLQDQLQHAETEHGPTAFETTVLARHLFAARFAWAREAHRSGEDVLYRERLAESVRDLEGRESAVEMSSYEWLGFIEAQTQLGRTDDARESLARMLDTDYEMWSRTLDDEFGALLKQLLETHGLELPATEPDATE